MTEIIQPRLAVTIEGSSPSGPVGPTNFVPPIFVGPPVNWSALPQGLNSGNVSADFIDVASDGRNFVVVGLNGWCARSEDNGATWSALPQGLNSGLATASFQGIAATRDGVFIAVAQNGFASRSLDGGETWTGLPQNLGVTPPVSFNRVATDGQSNWVAVANSAEVAYSTDNGATWNDGGEIGGLGSVVAYRGVIALGAGRFIVVTDNGGAGITTDSGATFGSFLVPQGLNSGSSTANFKDVAVIGDIIVVSGTGSRDAISEDNGATWMAAPSFFNSGNPGPTASGGLVSDDESVFVSVQESGWAAYSDDFGANWVPLPRGLNSGSTTANFNGLATNFSGVWVAVADSGFVSVGGVA